ncbi:hypothetical protein BU14_0192s0024 [Porphyra umbilicalis]|uniref:Uncharacterized protein n=1 Tax=Porphyra umbilicalis TaxID=2786 RepID=A0A1X6P6D2_PORUM|nr:hypothetical protein BU14_0192s0024 [Porphyra umbilicalis]|eukprot:OSX76407.1 hypothetical protein BU14_0192s0024 [Porphyra umbilicalis]
MEAQRAIRPGRLPWRCVPLPVAALHEDAVRPVLGRRVWPTVGHRHPSRSRLCTRRGRRWRCRSAGCSLGRHATGSGRSRGGSSKPGAEKLDALQVLRAHLALDRRHVRLVGPRQLVGARQRHDVRAALDQGGKVRFGHRVTIALLHRLHFLLLALLAVGRRHGRHLRRRPPVATIPHVGGRGRRHACRLYPNLYGPLRLAVSPGDGQVDEAKGASPRVYVATLGGGEGAVDNPAGRRVRSRRRRAWRTQKGEHKGFHGVHRLGRYAFSQRSTAELLFLSSRRHRLADPLDNDATTANLRARQCFGSRIGASQRSERDEGGAPKDTAVVPDGGDRRWRRHHPLADGGRDGRDSQVKRQRLYHQSASRGRGTGRLSVRRGGGGHTFHWCHRGQFCRWRWGDLYDRRHSRRRGDGIRHRDGR